MTCRAEGRPLYCFLSSLTTKKLFGVFSENMGPEQYKVLAVAIGEEIEKGAAGIVIGHGTDTMAHTGAIMSFMVQNSPVPIVLVGSQRSSDRPSSDARKEAVRDGAPPVELVDGEKLAGMLEKLELGLRPRHPFELDAWFFDEFKK